MTYDRSGIHEGMTVYSADGDKLGKVLSCDASMFTIEKGFFFPKDYVARYEDISDVTGDEIRLATTKDQFVRNESAATGTSGLGTSSGMGASSTSATARSATGEDVRVPVTEEELDVVKRDRQSGEVRLRKDVVTETKRVDVPVTREEVHVERVPITEQRAATPGESAFQNESVSVPIHEEEVEVRKRPVVKEEVRLRKDRFTEQRAAEADIRKEHVDIEGEGGARRVDEEPPGGTRRMMDDDLGRND